MKIYTSYFYQVRFFTPNIIPLSTARFDPKWFHQGRGQEYRYKDRRGVWNGLRAEPFVPGPGCDDLCYGPETCANLTIKDCPFKQAYYKQLMSLDFDDIMQRMENLGAKVQKAEGFLQEPVIVLLVHEAPTNTCSEREVIQAWFAHNGVEVKEWSKNVR